MHVTNLAVAQKEDSELDAVLQWLESMKKADLRTLLGECIMSKEGQMVWRNCQNFTSLWGTLYLCSTPKGENEDLLLFVVPKAHQTATLNGCHQDADSMSMTIPFPSYKNISGGQEWPSRWDKLSRPVDTASNMSCECLGFPRPFH